MGNNSFNLKGVRKRALLEEDEAKKVLTDDPRNNLIETEEESTLIQNEPKGQTKDKISKSRKDSILAKTRDPEYSMMTVYIPKELHVELKRALLDSPSGDISDLVASYILEGLLKNGVKLKNEKNLRKLMESKLK